VLDESSQFAARTERTCSLFEERFSGGEVSRSRHIVRKRIDRQAGNGGSGNLEENAPEAVVGCHDRRPTHRRGEELLTPRHRRPPQ
jgi:hypothetical protein